ncbi:MAG TPA: AMP-binding protein, partial [Ilumatobacteraceae bacterium]|nr:AMP-binding protein [Ilumatobacteraceae bacterium]
MGTPGVQFGDQFFAQEEIFDRGARAARGLASIGVRRGDVIATYLRNDIAFFETAIAAATLGVHIVPINWHFKTDEMRYVLDDCGARVLVAHTDLLAALHGDLPAAVTIFSVPTIVPRRHGAPAP